MWWLSTKTSQGAKTPPAAPAVHIRKPGFCSSPGAPGCQHQTRPGGLADLFGTFVPRA